MNTTNNEFIRLKNKTVGMNIAMYRKMRYIKAFDMADRLGLTESAYTAKERGETALTIEFIQKVADIIKIDPIQLMTLSPEDMIRNGTSPVTIDEHKNDIILTLITNQIEMNRNVIELLNK